MRMSLVVSLVFIVAISPYALGREREIKVTEGQISSVSKGEFELDKMVIIRLDKETVLYNEKTKAIPISRLQKDRYVTVICSEKRRGDLVAKEIYYHSQQERPRLSSQGIRYFKEAGIILKEEKIDRFTPLGKPWPSPKEIRH